MYKFGIIGLGKMGNSILEGILSSGIYKKDEILLGLHSEQKLEKYSNDGYECTLNNEDIFMDCEIILVSVKPQGFSEACENAKKYDFRGKCIISIMAGVKIETLMTYFNNASIFRTMPNTPALIKSGVTTICTNVENKFQDTVLDIFNSIGKAYMITEDLMDASLPLNGSMPAYLYLFAKIFIEMGAKNGIDYETAKALTAESIIASAKMIVSSDESIDTLINNVCSKGGTTIAGLYELYDNNFEEAIKKCYDACVNRSIELSKK